MEGGMVFEGSNNMAAFLQNDRLTSSSSQDLDSLWVSNSSHGENLKAAEMKPFSGGFEKEDDDYDKCDHQPEKKRRLTADQVHFLERSFEEENKLEPDRKMQLARELNLQPRQVAIWFQNRRARYKTKRLEKDYGVLKSKYDGLKSDFDTLRNNNDKLKLEVQMLVEKLLQREKGGKDSCTFDFSASELAKPSPNLISTRNWSNMPKVTTCKLEYAISISGKSDVIDSNSPNFTDGHHSSFLEPTNSSNMFENQSDFSQDEENNFNNNILRCPKIEYESYIDQNEGTLGYPIDDHPIWLWP